MDEIKLSLSIPADVDGFILLQCPLCGDFFKLRADEMQAEDVIDFCCPVCGFKSKDNYFTAEAINLALAKVENKVMNELFHEFEKMEQQTKGGLISFKAGTKPREKAEIPLIAGINEMEIQEYPCCKRQAKLKPIVKNTGSYCPYCGVRYD